MNTLTKFVLGSASASAVVLNIPSALALTFNWQFVTDSFSPSGPGLVINGTIEGLVEGSNPGPGLLVTVTSTPTGELTGGGWNFSQTSGGGDAFTVTGGQITFADSLFTRGDEQLFFGGFEGTGFVPQLVDATDSNPDWVSANGNVTYTLAPSQAVPEPQPFTILGTAAAIGFGAAFKRWINKVN